MNASLKRHSCELSVGSVSLGIMSPGPETLQRKQIHTTTDPLCEGSKAEQDMHMSLIPTCSWEVISVYTHVSKEALFFHRGNGKTVCEEEGSAVTGNHGDNRARRNLQENISHIYSILLTYGFV